MREVIKLIGRGSRLSLLQMEKVREKIRSAFPFVDVELLTRDSRGDALQDIPLHTVEGSDFFTQDIFDALASGEADIAVHSLKDMSGEHFFGTNKFAIVDRDDVRDVAIFNSGTEQKIRNGETIIIGTCSPRREEMATGFLQRALPQLNENFKVETRSIRGNVDTRLRKLDAGEYDGIILATAGLNRLLRNAEDAAAVRSSLADKRIMLLPLIECVPAPCQGAIVAETSPGNQKAILVLNEINDVGQMTNCIAEKQLAKQYGVGCLQKFGVTTVSYGSNRVMYAAGKDSNDEPFSKWTGLPDLEVEGKNFFSTTDLMGSFFKYQYNKELATIGEPVVYVSNYKAIEQRELIERIAVKRIWTAGTKTWFELSKKGLWVEGCADAFGLEFLLTYLQMPLVDISKNDMAIITNNESAGIWQQKGWKTYTTYSAVEKYSSDIERQIREADIIFWTSFRQYQQYKDVLKRDLVHACPYGETAGQFKATGIRPIVFPNIKAFQQWRQTSILSRIDA